MHYVLAVLLCVGLSLVLMLFWFFMRPTREEQLPGSSVHRARVNTALIVSGRDVKEKIASIWKELGIVVSTLSVRSVKIGDRDCRSAA